jgi:tripartite-type tricarboxylate transporter receptor subunit TctC
VVVRARSARRGASVAQFPDRAVTLIVPFAPGDETDTSARLIATKLTERWGRAVLVENKPGDAGVAAAEFVAKSKPDGHVLLIGNLRTQAINPLMKRTLPYDPDRALVPVSEIAGVPLVLLVHPSIKAQAPRDLVALAKARSTPLKYASSGNGSLMHLAAALFESVARVQFAHAPYKGEIAAISDLVAGRVDLAFAPLARGDRPHYGRQAAAARRHERTALARAAQAANRRRERLSRFPGRSLGRILAPGRHAGCHHRPDRPGRPSRGHVLRRAPQA